MATDLELWNEAIEKDTPSKDYREFTLKLMALARADEREGCLIPHCDKHDSVYDCKECAKEEGRKEAAKEIEEWLLTYAISHCQINEHKKFVIIQHLVDAYRKDVTKKYGVK